MKRDSQKVHQLTFSDDRGEKREREKKRGERERERERERETTILFISLDLGAEAGRNDVGILTLIDT